MYRHNRYLWMLTLVIGFLVISSAVGQESETVQKTLSNSNEYPWYDPETNSFRRVGSLQEDDDSSARNSGWESTLEDPDWDLNWNWGFGAAFWDAMQVVFWVVVGAILLALILILIWAFASSQTETVDEGNARDEISDATRVENLPFEVDPSKVDLMAEAKSAYESGNYNEAIIFLYSYLLVQLDKRHLIQLEKGKTNRQYLSEVHGRDTIRGILGQTMFVFEDVFFGQRNLDRARFEKCWNQLPTFQKSVETAS